MTNHIKDKAKSIKDADLALNMLLDEFQKKLNRDPKAVATAKQGYSYLPISHVNTLLNQTFLGLVKTEKFKMEPPMHMQLVASVELHVFHPIKKVWIIKTGVASTQIRCPKGSNTPIIGGLSMDVPRLLADCIKNAAKQFGKVFGADLNRKIESDYHAGVSDYVNKNDYDKTEILAAFKQKSTELELLTYWDTLGIAQNDKAIEQAFKEAIKDVKDITFS